MNYSICIETFFPKLGFDKKIDRLIELGFKRIEFWDHRDKDIDAIASLVKAGKVEISTFSGHRKGDLFSKPGFEEYLQEIDASIEAAKKLKAPSLMILSQGLQPDGRALPIGLDTRLKEEDLQARLKFNLQKLATIAEKAEITMLLEPLNSKIDHPGIFLDSSSMAFELVKEIKSPHLKVLYDIYHMQIMEGNIIGTLQKNISLIGYIHIADVPGRHEPGTGELNYGNILRAIRSAGYNGTVGFELFPSKESKEVLEGIRDAFLTGL